MSPLRPYSRTGLCALKARAKVKGLAAIDKRTLAAYRGVGLIPAFLRDLVCERHGDERRAHSIRRRPFGFSALQFTREGRAVGGRFG